MGLFSGLKKLFSESMVSYIAYGSGRRIARPKEDLYNSALWSCVINLSRLYATLPWHPYKKSSGGDRRQEGSSLLSELLRKPNPYMTDYEFRFVMGYNFEMHGEAPALIQRSRTGLPIALWPISPHTLVATEDAGKLYYVFAPTGERYRKEDILLLRNTPIGYGAGAVLEPIYFATSDLELEEKCKDLQKEYYDGSTVIGNVIKVPHSLPDEVRDKVKAMFDSGRGFRNYVISDSISVEPIQINNADITKLSEAQKWNASEVARRFNVPPFFIGDTTGTYNNTEQQGLMMVIYCLQPRITAWESALNASICRSNEYVKFSLEGLMRGDHSTRASFYHNGLMDGWLSINEVRRKEELEGIGTDGDQHFFPMNYATLQDVVSGKYATGSSFSFPTEPAPQDTEPGKPSEKKEDTTKLDEKRSRDLRFVTEARRAASSDRTRIERMMRSDIRRAIDHLHELLSSGSLHVQVLEDFSSWLNSYAAEITPSYKAVYQEILERLIPVVQKAAGTSKSIPKGNISYYAGTYAESAVDRLMGNIRKKAKETIDLETFENDISTFKQDYPISAAEEEVNRSSNAFSVWIFGAVGVSVYHVVAASNSCSFCASLDGKVTSVHGTVLTKGSDVDDGEGGIRHIDKDYAHPPVHGHCKCHVAPGE